MSDAGKKLTTYMMLGQIMHDQEVAAGKRKPDEPQLQLTGEGWRVWGGDIEEPIPQTVAHVYSTMLKDGTPEQAQGVLDMTRERCKELRGIVIQTKGKGKKELEGHLENLRKELNEAVEIKKEKGITSIS